jgi:hypothetical protein
MGCMSSDGNVQNVASFSSAVSSASVSFVVGQRMKIVNQFCLARDRSRHANVMTPARYSRREYMPDRNPRSRSLLYTNVQIGTRGSTREKKTGRDQSHKEKNHRDRSLVSTLPCASIEAGASIGAPFDPPTIAQNIELCLK